MRCLQFRRNNVSNVSNIFNLLSFFKCQPFNSKFNDTIINSISCTFDDTVDVPNTLKILLISMLRKDPRDRFSIK